MELSYLIPSSVRRRVLAYYCKNEEEQPHVRELARVLNEAPQLIYRELMNLENWGFLTSYKRGNQRLFMVNQRFALKGPVFDLFRTIDKIQNMKITVSEVYDWEKLQKDHKKVKIEDDLHEELSLMRKKPRAYAEEKLLEEKKLL